MAPGSTAAAPAPGRAGHRSVPHTADLRIEAWAPTREECLGEAVQAVAESFVDTAAAAGGRSRELRVRADRDEDLLAALLDEIVYRLDTEGEVPVGVEAVDPAPDGGVRVGLRMADVESLPVIGATPKAVTLHGLSFTRAEQGWTCSVTLDV